MNIEQNTKKEAIQEKERLHKLALKKGYGAKARHIFFCTGEQCSNKETNIELFKYLKNKIDERNDPSLLRSKSECLKLCSGGPLALVYPEGTFYHDLNKEKIDKITEEHLIGGKPVKEYSFFTQELIS